VEARPHAGGQRQRARQVDHRARHARVEPAEGDLPGRRRAVLGGRHRQDRHAHLPRPLSGSGVLAFGDSITNGGGELQWGVALQSWALWTARGLGLPYTGYAVDGAFAADVVERQLPLFARASAVPDARYDVGCLYIGVNDVRTPEWSPDAFARDHAAALAALRERCDRVLAVTLPLDLGRPLAAGTQEANAVIEAAAREHGALLLDLRDFGARNLVMVDHVHPTAFGQVWIAERALDVLARDGMQVRLRPHTLIHPASGTRRQRLQGDWTYVYRAMKVWAAARRAARAARARSDSSPTRAR
jgi:lysophospholipase L1-like esterase